MISNDQNYLNISNQERTRNTILPRENKKFRPILGLYWRALPDSTQASKADKNTPGRKISKDRVSALLCANADGSHMLKPVIVGKMPEIRRYQTKILKIPDDKVKTLVLLDNYCPAHPQKKLLNEISEVEEPAAGEEDRRGYKTLQNLKDYNIRSMIYNFASAVKDIKLSTLINSWKKLLINEEVESDTAELETDDFHNIFHQGGENSATLEDIEGGDCVTATENPESDEYDQEEADDNVNPKPKLGEIKDHLNIVIKYVEDNNDENISAYHEHLRHLRELIIKEITVKGRQPKISSFFKPVSSVNNEGVP
ncbi:tigger transposable element-derived protein 7-like [Metopolophium dirhodum]|uniref:tigger transposable element-derived protein 7-like n=1 Tax=Metopolophium dirhodum TaxID=44670 RepID=UPI00298F9AEF|nr:tigger transposable element-derived protein 7-like [Metopolophium dirhodum]